MFIKQNHVITLTMAAMILTGIIFLPPSVSAGQQSDTVSVTVETPLHGTIKLTPAITTESQVPLGTVVTVKATPAPGYAVDSI